MERRLRALERLVRGEAGGRPGLDGLLDLLLGLHHELSSAPLRRERNVAQFLSWGEWPRGDTGCWDPRDTAPGPSPPSTRSTPPDHPAGIRVHRLSSQMPRTGPDTCHRTRGPSVTCIL